MSDTTKPPSARFEIPCVILAGGQSRRFGSNKAFAQLHGRRLVDILVHRLAMQSAGPMAINAANATDYADLSLAVLSDRLTGQLGPLAGLHTAMYWAAAQGYPTIVTTPVDTPLLPVDFIRRLSANKAPVIAASNGRLHPTHGIWPTALHNELALAIKDGMRAAHDWQAFCRARQCDFTVKGDTDPFTNINRPEELAELEKI